jgi:beta-glucosidase
MKKTLIPALLALALTGCGAKVEVKESALMKNEDRITEIMSKMTLEEKVAMLHGKHMFSSEGVPSQGIADIEYADGPFGIREEMEPHSWNSIHLDTDSATFFPTGSALAATWSDELAREYGKGMSIEARLRGKDMILGPAINIQRVPTGGRTYEYFSEDPLLSSVLATEYVLGVQENGTAVCLKHYALNNQEDHRGYVDVQVSERAMREIYLPPFEMSVRKGDAWGVMSAYNKVRGYWCSENKELLTDILRDDWGFKGIVISDWGGTHSVKAVEAGLNVEMPGASHLGKTLLDSLAAGVVSVDAVDQRVRELLRVRLAVEPIPAEKANVEMTSQPVQQKIAYNVAAHSVVLLKNEGLLPIDTQKYKKIAVIGDNAVQTQSLGGVGAGVKTLYEVTPLAGILSRLEGKAEVTYAQGYAKYTAEDRYRRMPAVREPDQKLMEEAVELAGKSDLVIFVAGNNREIETEGSDRTNIMLPMGQNELIKALAAVNPNIVTVVVTGAPADLRVVKEISPSILVSWFNGSEGGNALADILVGNIAPSGKLPFTFPVQLEDNPAYALGVFPQKVEMGNSDVFVNLVNRRRDRNSIKLEADYAEDIFVGYRWYEAKDVPVLYPFGHGLSYVDFEYSDLTLKSSAKGVKVSFNITNTGGMEAEEVVQIYAGRPESVITRPEKELAGFQRVTLQAGETKNVTVDIDKEVFRHWDEASDWWAVEKGAADFFVGSSSDDIRLTGKTTIK